MGWCNGSYLAEDIWQLIKEYLPEDKKPEIAKEIYNLFCDMDADDWQFEEGSLAAEAEPEEYKKYLKDI